MTKTVHLVKLSVGTEDIPDLDAWHRLPQAQSPDGLPWHITRMWPKREAEVLNGGSIYWVIKGEIQGRQRIVRLDEVTGNDGIRRCAIVLDPEIVRVAPRPNGPFRAGAISIRKTPLPISNRRARVRKNCRPSFQPRFRKWG